MNFDFSDEQKQLGDLARSFLAKECPVEKVRAVLDNPDKRYDQALWQAIAAQGWLGTTIPEEYGGLGLGYLELCRLAEELGRSLAPTPFASTVYLFTEALLLAGSDEQKQRYLPKVAAGELIGAFATAEKPGPLKADAIAAKVEGGKLSGAKAPVTDGTIADVAIVLAKENGQPALFLVELGRGGVERRTLETLDPTRDAAQLTFNGAAAERLGGGTSVGDGLQLVDKVFDRAAVLVAFEQVGGADRALEIARAYALERHAFGRPIASYQALKHRMADMYIKNVLARSNAYYGAWALNTNAAELPTAAAAARVAACDAYWFASKEDIQIHGGMGFTWDIDAHLYYRRAIQLALLLGAPRAWKQRLVDHLAQELAAA